MPSIANSSKDINGPVVIDPEIPTEYEKPLAVHETVEQTLMAKGMPYLQAHPIATQAERTVAEHMGINWDDYSTYFKDVAPRIEAQKIMPDTWDNLDLHTDPYAAIKHHTDKDIAADFRQDISEPALGQVPDTSGIDRIAQRKGDEFFLNDFAEAGHQNYVDAIHSLPVEYQHNALIDLQNIANSALKKTGRWPYDETLPKLTAVQFENLLKQNRPPVLSPEEISAGTKAPDLNEIPDFLRRQQ